MKLKKIKKGKTQKKIKRMRIELDKKKEIKCLRMKLKKKE
jgi:hypothetical protein